MLYGPFFPLVGGWGVGGGGFEISDVGTFGFRNFLADYFGVAELLAGRFFKIDKYNTLRFLTF